MKFFQVLMKVFADKLVALAMMSCLIFISSEVHASVLRVVYWGNLNGEIDLCG